MMTDSRGNLLEVYVQAVQREKYAWRSPVGITVIICNRVFGKLQSIIVLTIARMGI